MGRRFGRKGPKRQKVRAPGNSEYIGVVAKPPEIRKLSIICGDTQARTTSLKGRAGDQKGASTVGLDPGDLEQNFQNVREKENGNLKNAKAAL